MHVIVNGKSLELETNLPLLGLLERLGKVPAHVAIEHNGEILEPAEMATALLRENDRLEIVHFVGGG
jgi:thiamine biosynthesis protein ThiS